CGDEVQNAAPSNALGSPHPSPDRDHGPVNPSVVPAERLVQRTLRQLFRQLRPRGKAVPSWQTFVEYAGGSRAMNLRKLLRLILILGVVAMLAACEPANRAGALRWRGSLETDVSFSEFYGGDHTVALWFMAQYENAYQG